MGMQSYLNEMSVKTKCLHFTPEMQAPCFSIKRTGVLVLLVPGKCRHSFDFRAGLSATVGLGLALLHTVLASGQPFSPA